MIIKVRGVTYPSVKQAALSLDVSEAAVYSALWRGKMELLGLGNTKRKPVEVEGLSFPSIASAARALGLSEKYVRKVISTDSPTGMKRFRAAAVAYKQNMGVCDD
jgi:hypothetical protein